MITMIGDVMKNNKGFTLIELLGVIVILAILMSMATFAYSGYLKRSREKSFDIAVNSFEDAAASALEDCETNIGTNTTNAFCNQHPGIPGINEEDTIYLEDLVRYHYIDKIKSPYKTDEVCSGTTKVKRVPVSSIKHTRKNEDGTITEEIWDGDEANINLEYTTCLVCSGHSSKGC